MTTSKESDSLLNQTGALLAISSDEVTNWKLVKVQSRQALKVLFPNIADKFKLPADFVE